MKNESLKMSSPTKSDEKKQNENEDEKEKAKNLVNYAHKHQQTKESHRPGISFNYILIQYSRFNLFEIHKLFQK